MFYLYTYPGILCACGIVTEVASCGLLVLVAIVASARAPPKTMGVATTQPRATRYIIIVLVYRYTGTTVPDDMVGHPTASTEGLVMSMCNLTIPQYNYALLY